MLKRGQFAIFVTFGALFAVFAAIYFVVTSPYFQKKAIHALTSGSLQLDPKIDLFRNTLSADNISFSGKSGLNIQADAALVRYNPLGLLRGKLIMTRIDIKGLRATPPPSSGDIDKAKKRLSIKKLFFLQNIVIDEANIENSAIDLSDGSSLVTDTMTLHFAPRFSGDVALSVKLQGALFKTEERSVSLGGLSIKGKTNLTEWTDLPPFVNSLHGSISLKDADLGGIRISGITAKADIKDNRYRLEDLELTREGGAIKGVFEYNKATKDISGGLSIPDGIQVPKLGGENPTIDTSGTIKGKIDFRGKWASIKDSSVDLNIDLTQEKEALPDLNVKAEASWRNGTAELREAKVSLGEGKIDVTGSVSITGRRMDLKCSGENIPLEGIFRRFDDPNFHPIFGTAKANATVTGWGKAFKVIGEADTTAAGGYYKITTDHAHATVEATYDQLTLIGDINDGGKRSGDITLKIKYGAKQKGRLRPKTLFIEANAINNDLGKSFRDYGLSGTGNAHMLLEGPQQGFKSKISATIDNGSFAGIAFQKVAAVADMTYKKISVVEGEVVLPNVQPIPIASPINMDLETGGFRLYGRPTDYLSFDTHLTGKTDTWNIKNIDYKGLHISGTYSPKGSVGLAVDGSIDGKDLSAFKTFLRDAEGVFAGRLKISGPAADPSVNGEISFDNNMIFPRALTKRLEKMNGVLKFEGRTISTERIAGVIEDGPFELKGYVQHAKLAPQRFDVVFKGNDLRYTLPDRTFRFEFDADLKLTGTAASSLIAGSVSILEGKYTKDFTVIDSLTKKNEVEKDDLLKGSDAVKLDLKIKNTGDLMVKNNIGQVWLRADVDVKGTTAHPLVSGTVETPEGKIHYLGRDFNITRGFVEFKAPYTIPYVEITAEHEVVGSLDLVIYVTLRGRVNNLQLDLSATKPLDQRDIISMLLFGSTEQELREAQLGGSASSSLGMSMAASQLGSFFEAPVAKLTHFDVVRLEGSPTATTTSSRTASRSSSISKVYVSKQLSDRLNFHFWTDIGMEDAQQTVKAEYMLTDFFLIDGERATGQNYNFNLILRFRER